MDLTSHVKYGTIFSILRKKRETKKWTYFRFKYMKHIHGVYIYCHEINDNMGSLFVFFHNSLLVCSFSTCVNRFFFYTYSYHINNVPCTTEMCAVCTQKVSRYARYFLNGWCLATLIESHQRARWKTQANLNFRHLQSWRLKTKPRPNFSGGERYLKVSQKVGKPETPCVNKWCRACSYHSPLYMCRVGIYTENRF